MMPSWADKADAAYELAVEMAEKLREIHPNHELLKFLNAFNPHQAVIVRFMDGNASWQSWLISRVLAVAYTRYYLALKEIVEGPQTPAQKIVPKNPIFEKIDRLCDELDGKNEGEVPF